MALLTLRVQTAAGQNTKNAPLTNIEIDNNFINIDSDIQNRVLKTGDTLSGKLNLALSTATNASLRIDAGVQPTSPLSGDIWATSAGLFYRQGTVTKSLAFTDSAIGFANFAVSGQPTVSAEAAGDTLTLVPGTGISITTDEASDSITIRNSAFSFNNIAVSGQPTISAEAENDTLTFVAGAGITLTTNATNDSVTITSTGSGGGSSGPLGVDILKEEFTSTAGQTIYPVTGGFTNQDKVQVYFNGALLSGSDYVLATPNVTLNQGADAGDLVVIIVTKGVALLSQITVNPETQNVSAFITFADRTSGQANLKTSNLLTYNPESGALSATDFNSTSDVNLKKDIVKIENSLETISKLNGYTFKYKLNDKESAGVIAQEIAQVLPHAVSDNNGVKNVSYMQIIAYLIEGMKEQQFQINLLKEEINSLRNR